MGLIEDAESGLPEALREAFAEVCNEIRTLEERLQGIEQQLEVSANGKPAGAAQFTVTD